MAITAFRSSIKGQWQTICSPNSNQSSNNSWKGGWQLTDNAFTYFSYYYPSNRDCSGNASPVNGNPQTFQLNWIRMKKDGWFLLEGICSSCTPNIFTLMAKLESIDNQNKLHVRKVKDEFDHGDWQVFTVQTGK